MVTKEPDETAAPPLTLKREPLSGFCVSIATVLSLLSRVTCTCLGQASAQSNSSTFRLVSKKHFFTFTQVWESSVFNSSENIMVSFFRQKCLK